MFDTPIINLIILLSFTYFIGSLILSSINEFIAAIFRLRQNHLKDALEKLFFDLPGTPAANTWKTFVATTFMNSPHIQALQKSANKYPSYIPAKNFVLALIGKIGATNFNAASLADAITASGLPQQCQKVLLDLFAKTQNNIQDFQKELEGFYNDVMDRAGGWYKRKVRTIMLFVALSIAIILNLDTIKISNDALKDPDKLSKTADKITAEINKYKISNGVVTIKDTAGKIVSTISTKNDTSALKSPKNDLSNLEISYSQTTGYQMGYNNDFKKEWSFDNANGYSLGFICYLSFWKKLLGILITVAALQLGANYWFDLLNKVVNLRAAGKKPNEKKK